MHRLLLLVFQQRSWFGGSVLEKLEDPAYAGFFLSFRPENGTKTTSPRCDAANRSKCSKLYHSQTLAPKAKGKVQGWDTCKNFSTCDGFCRSGQCDCGSIPCGSYVFDHRNGTMLRNWLVDEYVGGVLGVGAPGGLVDGMFFVSV